MKLLSTISGFKLSAQAAIIALGCSASLASGGQTASVSIDPSVTIAETKDNRLLGGNIALWYNPEQLSQLGKSKYLKQWKPGILRIPGGSWSDETYWNGNGVRDGKKFDLSKRKGHQWEIDYSDWKPGFSVLKDGSLADFHGHTDMLQLHKFAKAHSQEAMVTVNAGMGTPEMAAEWVRWANKKMGFDVKYWEIGNELEGDWELGNIRPDGTKMDATKYAALYTQFAKAMKAVDPTIKIGGATNSSDSIVYVEELLKQAGDHVDFISFHTYPVDARIKEPRKVLNEAARLSRATDNIHKWIKQYQPKRSGEIEIGITEWHVQVHENENTCNILSGVWCCRFIGEMFKSKVTFANQWDTFSTTAHGGHGLFSDKDLSKPRAPYWALWLWSNHMGDRLVESNVNGHDDVISYATMDGDTPAIMLINQSADEVIKADINGLEYDSGQAITLSNNNYLWDHFLQIPVWSLTPTASPLDFTKQKSIELPPLSATVIRLGEKVKDVISTSAESARPDILLPRTHPADLPLDTHLILFSGDKKLPYTGAPTEIKITTEGPIKVSSDSITTNKPASHIHFTPTGSGDAKIILSCGDLKVERTLKLVEVKSRKHVLWTFGKVAEVKQASAHLPTALNTDERRNEDVYEVSFDDFLPAGGNNHVLEINPLELDFPKANIGGLIVKLKASKELLEAPKGASLQIALQSNGNHWIQLKAIPFHKLKQGDNWKGLEFIIKDGDLLKVMPELYSIVFKVKSPKPLNGKLFVDDLGFILRTKTP